MAQVWELIEGSRLSFLIWLDFCLLDLDFSAYIDVVRIYY